MRATTWSRPRHRTWTWSSIRHAALRRRRRHRRRRARRPVLRAEARAAAGDASSPPRRSAQGASSAWAQGGIAAAVAEGDTPEAHAARHDRGRRRPRRRGRRARRWRAKAPRPHPRSARATACRSTAISTASSLLGREAAHSARRIVHVHGDQAGAAIMAALVAAVRQHAVDPRARRLRRRGPVVRGRRGSPARASRRAARRRRCEHRSGAARSCSPPAASAHLYAVTTNPPRRAATASRMAARAGAVIADPEFVQFHPTAHRHRPRPGAAGHRGAARRRRDADQRAPASASCSTIHPDAELAPRDIVARGVFAEIAAGRGAFLDAAQAIGARFAEEFPDRLRASATAAGIDPARAADPGRAGRALPHGRHRDRRARPHLA